jgi:hypothetical protein
MTQAGIEEQGDALASLFFLHAWCFVPNQLVSFWPSGALAASASGQSGAH